MKIALIAGARPNFIKLSPLVDAIIKEQQTKDLSFYVIHTGQHYDDNMSSVFFEEMNIPEPEYRLGIGSGTHAYQTGTMMIEIEKIFMQDTPDYAIMIGDTNSTLAGALTAAKLKIPIAHIEAGLRSFDKRIPEEINRVLCDHVSALLFPPTDAGVENLLNEGLPKENIFNFGDVMYDTALRFSKMIDASAETFALGNTTNNFALATIHRGENTDNFQHLTNIVALLEHIAKDREILFPVHPRTLNKLKEHKELLSQLENKNIVIREPLTYKETIFALKNASFVITDSGGLQKESFFFSKKCLNIFHSTPWPELKNDGWLTLCPPADLDKMKKIYEQFLTGQPLPAQKFYGEGNASELMIKTIITRSSNGN